MGKRTKVSKSSPKKKGAKPETLEARKITYVRRTGETKMDGVRSGSGG